MTQFTLWNIVSHLLTGMGWTAGLSLAAFILGSTAGMITLFARISAKPFLRRAAKIYIEFFQGTPLLMQLFLLFFGLALVGIEISPLVTTLIGLTFFYQRLPCRNLARMR